MSFRPVYLLDPGGACGGLDDLVPGHREVRIGRASELRGRPPGVLLIPLPGTPADEVLAAVAIVAEAAPDAAWLPILVEPGASSATG